MTKPTATAQVPDSFASRPAMRDLIPRREGENHPPIATPPTPATPAAPEPDLAGLQTALDQAAAAGTTAALTPLMTAVGVTTPEALQEWINTANAERTARLTEDQRREQELAQREAAVAAAAEQAATATRNATILAALLKAGAPVDNAADLIPLVTLPKGDVTDEQIVGAVDAAKAKFAALFTIPATPPVTTPPAPSSRAPQSPTPAAPAASDPFARGRERAQKAAQRNVTKEDLINDFTPGRSPLLPSA